MKNFCKVTSAAVIVALMSAMPVMAQIDNGMDFTTSFPFYVQNTKLPAGAYQITQSDIDTKQVLVRSADDRYSVFVDFIPTQADQPHKQSDVNFHKYGTADYLNRIWVEGQRYGLRVVPSKAEKKPRPQQLPMKTRLSAASIERLSVLSAERNFQHTVNAPCVRNERDDVTQPLLHIITRFSLTLQGAATHTA